MLMLNVILFVGLAYATSWQLALVVYLLTLAAHHISKPRRPLSTDRHAAMLLSNDMAIEELKKTNDWK